MAVHGYLVVFTSASMKVVDCLQEEAAVFRPFSTARSSHADLKLPVAYHRKYLQQSTVQEVAQRHRKMWR